MEFYKILLAEKKFACRLNYVCFIALGQFNRNCDRVKNKEKFAAEILVEFTFDYSAGLSNSINFPYSYADETSFFFRNPKRFQLVSFYLPKFSYDVFYNIRIENKVIGSFVKRLQEYISTFLAAV